MLKSISIAVIIVFLVSNSSIAYSEGAKRDKTVLVLFALEPSRPAYSSMLDGIRQKLTEEYGDSYSLHAEYLETNNFEKNRFPKERFDLYNKKYSDLVLDLLICVGPNITDIIRQNADSHLLNLPSVSIDWDMPEHGSPSLVRLNDHTTMIGLRVDAESTIHTAMSLFPDFPYLYFVCGMSLQDRMFYSLSLQAATKIGSDKKVSFITNVSMDEALYQVRKIPDSSILIMASFDQDAILVPYYNDESVKLFNKSANIPVFTYTDIGFGNGAVGGYILSFNRVGLMAGESAIKILNGTDPKSILLTEKDYYDKIFDWRELERWNLTGSRRIPKGSKVLYEEINFFSKYRLFILSGIFFLILQTILILNLIINYRRQRLMNRQLQESESRFRELVREDRILRTGQLTASLSHELNQPLTAILSTAQAGLRFIDSKNQDSDLMKEILQNIVEDDKRAASIINSIRGMMKHEKREKEKVNLNEVIDELLAIYKIEAINRRIRLDESLCVEPVYIMADRVLIQQVIMNFILNAFQSVDQANQKNKIVSLTESTDHEYVTVSVRDHGQGIKESIIENIFKPFVTTKQEGMGIGLALSHSIIGDHKGKIWAENMPDGGARFSFSLKIYQDE